MRAFTEKQRQWLWFGLLWCAGLAAAFILASVVRWVASAG